MDKAEALASIPEAQTSYEAAYEGFLAAVGGARRAGASWAEIGQVVGLPRQVAHYRWQHLDGVTGTSSTGG